MSEERKPHFWPWIIVALVAVLVLYPLSIGPAVWLTARSYFRESTVNTLYWPVFWSAAQAAPLEDAVGWWCSLGIPDGQMVTLEIDTDETLAVFQFGESYSASPGGVM